jgi:alpha-N-arabinofuranosidase
MANVAQLVNNIHTLFHADGDKFVATPNFYVFEMYRPHHDAQGVRLDVQAPAVSFNAKGPTQVFRVAGSASHADRRVTVTLVHTHAREPAEVSLSLRSGSADHVDHTVLTHKSLNAHNTFEQPDELVPKTSSTSYRGSTFTCVLPPASVNRFDIAIA